jgi:hypothetical protein
MESHRFRICIKPPWSREAADNRRPARQLDPVAVGVEDHRYPRHLAERHRGKTLAHALASQPVMHRVDVGNLQGDVAPAARLTNRIDGRVAVFLEHNEAVAKAKAAPPDQGCSAKPRAVMLLPAYTKRFPPETITTRPVQGEVPMIDLVLAYHKANKSPILKLLLSRVGRLAGTS